jgi:mannan endo-1,4-beta-mannosidase
MTNSRRHARANGTVRDGLLAAGLAFVLSAWGCSAPAGEQGDDDGSGNSGRGGSSNACGLGQVDCLGSCVNTELDPTHCGSCGKQCARGESCSSGVCHTPGSSGGAAGTAGTGTSGAGGTAGSATSSGGSATSGAGGGSGGSGAPNDLPGVVVATDDAGTLGCVPLCQNAEHPDDSDATDDWAYEGVPCVLPDSPTGTRNQTCTTGQPLPAIDRSGLPGVVVDAGGDMTLDCVPLCEPGGMASNPDPANPSSYDWGWEYQASCIVRETPTALCNQGCTTGQALPSPTLVQRAGVLNDEVCVATCTCTDVGADPEYPDWGWEFQTECLVEGSPTAADKPSCTTNDTEMLLPPAVAGATRPGFYTENGKLKDAKGADFVMRGVNNPHVWFDTGNQYRAYQALDQIASYKTNTIRVVWDTETEGATASLLRRVLFRIVELKMVPMVELHDVTGQSGAADLARMAAYYTNAEVKQVLLDFRAYLLVNIANEWSGSDGIFTSAYTDAINTLRSAGIEHTLVIDANGFGQNANSVLNNAATLLAADPLHNLLFSVHMYSQYASSAQVDAVLGQSAVGTSIPLVVGEFGPELQGTNVAWQQILTRCQERGIGYIAWSWSGNDQATSSLNIVNDWSGSLTPSWGQQVMVSNPNSIQNTSLAASIFP